ncbi:hypothetical protein BX600DRAFT_476849 [Xylariales sp. PMI_506]|nr:hypothetical protein BX600DRAFT_476849 [Xylariales sp. PMI_506]
MNCTLQEVCPACDDSPLSYTGNVTGILTFALGLIASCVAFLSITRNAENEIQTLNLIVVETNQHISDITGYITRLELRRVDNPLLVESLHNYDTAQREVADYLSKFITSTSLWNRLKWWYMAKETAAMMARLNNHQQRITAIQLTFLVQQSDDQSREILKLSYKKDKLGEKKEQI